MKLLFSNAPYRYYQLGPHRIRTHARCEGSHAWVLIALFCFNTCKWEEVQEVLITCDPSKTEEASIEEVINLALQQMIMLLDGE